MRRMLAVMVLLAGCGGSTAPAALPTSGPELRVSETRVADGVLEMDSVCFEAERCDGLDSDCDGRIDETCLEPAPERPADLQLGLGWNDGSTLEVVLAPEIAVAHSMDSGAACEDETQPRVARRFHAPLAPGEYRVSLARTDACPAAEGTRASVAVSVFGRLLGTYVVPVDSDSVDVVSFTVER